MTTVPRYRASERIFEGFKRVRAWVDIDGTHDIGPGPRYSPSEADTRYALSRCMACASCMEACPNFGPQSDFVAHELLPELDPV